MSKSTDDAAVIQPNRSQSPPRSLRLDRLQREVHIWANHNFGAHDHINPLLGLVEEVGELSHAVLKRRQGIRGDLASLRAEELDAVGDILIYLADYCNSAGVDMQRALDETWAKVKLRDWVMFPKDGLAE